jgi:predicted permease
MSTLPSLARGIRALFHRRRRNAEIREEVLSFEHASIEEKMWRGMDLEAAVRAARAEIGSAETVRQKVWSAGWESAAESFAQDVRYGLRQLLRSPGFSTVAILSLALGIGANTAIFTLMNDLLLKQLPVRDPQQLVSFGDGSSSGTMEATEPGAYDVFPYEFYRRIAAHQDQFESVCAFSSFPTSISVRSGASGPATQAVGHLVSGTFFSVLGAEPLLGRTFHADDTATVGRNAIAVISHRYWQQELAADPAVIGRSLLVNGTPFTVAGVMPAKFYGVALDKLPPDMWLPITMQQQVMLQSSLLHPDGLFWIHIMARQKVGVPRTLAEAWVTAQFREFLTDREGTGLSTLRRQQISGSFVPLLPGGSGLSSLRSDYQTPLTILMVMVGVVLLIACANLANLVLAKSVAREREFSVRLALGSSRGRIMRQLLTEAILLAFLGGALGEALAFWATGVFIHFIDGGAAHSVLAATPDPRVLGFTSAVCVLTGVLFGIAPAWRAARSSQAETLHASARLSMGTVGRGARLFSRTLVVSQVTLSLVLLVVAGLLLRTLYNLRNQDLGFERDHLLLVRTNPKFAGYRPEQLNALYNRILERVDALPGVRSATLSGAPLMAAGTWGSPIFLDGRPSVPGKNPETLLNRVSAGYFETVGIPLLRGRTIGSQDAPGSVKAAVVNQALANRYFPGGDAIGHPFRVEDPEVTGSWEIVGVVRDAKYNSPAEKPQPFAYLSVTQLTGNDQYAYCLQIRTNGDPGSVLGEVRAALAALDPNLPVLEARTVAEDVNHLTDEQQFISQLSGFFSFLALSLACVGLYGVMSYNVVRRRHEIGIRIALGAPNRSISWLVLQELLALFLIGVSLGIPAALAATHLMRAGLFGVTASDPLTLILAIVVIGAVIAGAGYLPARRAAKIDPIVTLRCE